MAISFVQGTWSGTSSSVTLTGVTTGNLVVVSVISNSSGGGSLSDTAGNNYSLQTGFSTYTGAYISIFYANFNSSGNITATFSGSGINSIVAQEFSGVPAATLDKQTSAYNIMSFPTATVGPTAATTQAEELVVGIFGFNRYNGANVATLGSGYSNLTTDTSAGSSGFALSVESKVVSSTGTQTATMTYGNNGNVEGVIATFYGNPPRITGLSSVTGLGSITF